jgi:hypothetical protein
MSLEAGRGRLYSALKTIQARWGSTDSNWQDTMKVQFVEQVLNPLEEQTAAALQAIDQMEVLLHLMRRECEGNSFDIHGGGPMEGE